MTENQSKTSVSLLLDVWREACRHTDIGEAVAQSAPTLFRRLPVDLVLVRRFQIASRLVETVATGVCRPGTDKPVEPRMELPVGAFERLLLWSRQGDVAHARDAKELDLPPGTVPQGVRGEVMVGPLNSADGPVGLVIFVTHEPRRFTDRHRELLKELLEPFTVWVENDHRQRELSALREAAEADNRLLLSRLGRHDISDTIIGVEAGLKDVMERVEQVARTDVPLLILGETGSGKEVVARSIHQRSRRSTGPFLRVNCGAIPSELIDSELFGHERGSFTGATGLRKGWFERADGGTLLLDECGELTLPAQVRLLRILQDGTFQRVGGESQITVDVRIVAATHRNLQAMVREATFREDLWYRLSVFPIRLPPLRDRLEDIPAMDRHFASRASQRLGFPGLPLSADDLHALVGYPWPGNVRELAAVMERAVILGEGKKLAVAQALGIAPQTGFPIPETIRPAAATPVVAAQNLPELAASLDDAIKEHIESALRKTLGRIEGPFGAAQLLQINPHTLRGRMRSLAIDWRKYRPPRPSR